MLELCLLITFWRVQTKDSRVGLTHIMPDVYCRCEIEATLERLKKLERDLSTKEQELKQRERRLKMWERKLIEQSNSPVSSSLSPLHLCSPCLSGRQSHSVKWSQLLTPQLPFTICCSHVHFLGFSLAIRGAESFPDMFSGVKWK